MIKFISKSILGGIGIGLGALAFGATYNINDVVAYALFSVGILIIIEYDLYLFTSFVPKQRENFSFFEYTWRCLLVCLGNAVGCLLLGYFMMTTRLHTELESVFSAVLDKRFADDWYGIITMGIMCGVLIGALSKMKKFKNNVLLIVIIIMVFAICGFDHVVASSFYLAVTGEFFTPEGLYLLGLSLVGNFIGGLAFSYIDYVSDDPEIIEKLSLAKKNKD